MTTALDTTRLLDPTGADQLRTDDTLSPRPQSLDGVTIGLLDNTKPNATAFLDAILAELVPRFQLGEVKRYVKSYFSTPAEAELLDRIASECDVVITAVGDCGSCSAGTVADGILLERRGVPTVSVCSDSFVMSGRAMASVQGFPDYRFVTVAHPIASLDAAGLADRAREAIDEVLATLGTAA